MWTLRFWIPALLIGLILTLCAAPFTASVRSQSPPSPPTPAAKTAREFVLSGGCVKSVAFAPEFKFHVPMDDKGEPMAERAYTTGSVRFEFDRDAEGCEYKIVSKEIIQEQ